MTGTHHFVNAAGPDGEHPMSFHVTWGTRHLASYLRPFQPGFLSSFLEGTVDIGGLVQGAACRGTLDLRYFSEAKIRYCFDFKDEAGRPLHYVGEKVDLRPWNLHRTHTTCYGTVTDIRTGQDISRSILRFELGSLPAFLASFRLA